MIVNEYKTVCDLSNDAIPSYLETPNLFQGHSTLLYQITKNSTRYSTSYNVKLIGIYIYHLLNSAIFNDHE